LNYFQNGKKYYLDNKLQISVPAGAIAEIINFDEQTSWIRWYMPDFSNNGNINLPSGNYKIKNQILKSDEILIILERIINDNHYRTK
jgi:hypothetical protein